jgi:uncharacterized membrane protein YqaE (UPF0057 family)
MKRILQAGIFSALAATLILSSCSRDNSVASNHSIQKRKYTNGYHVHFNGLKKSQNEKENRPAETEYKKVNSNDNLSSENVATNYTFVENIESTQEVSVAQTYKEASPTKVKSNKKSHEKQLKLALSIHTAEKEIKSNFNAIKKLSKTDSVNKKANTSLEPIVYVLLCLLIPFLAVGFATDWNLNDVLLNILLCILCGIPGIIHAFIVCYRKGVI